MGAIVDIQLERLMALLAERKIVLDLGADARDWLATRVTTRSTAHGR